MLNHQRRYVSVKYERLQIYGLQGLESVEKESVRGSVGFAERMKWTGGDVDNAYLSVGMDRKRCGENVNLSVRVVRRDGENADLSVGVGRGRYGENADLKVDVGGGDGENACLSVGTDRRREYRLKGVGVDAERMQILAL